MTVRNEGSELAVEVNNPGYWLTGCCGYRWIAQAGSLVVFAPDERSPMHIKVATEVTAADAPKNRSDR